MMSGGASVLNLDVRAVWIIIVIIIYWIDVSLGTSSYTSTDKTNKNYLLHGAESFLRS